LPLGRDPWPGEGHFPAVECPDKDPTIVKRRSAHDTHGAVLLLVIFVVLTSTLFATPPAAFAQCVSMKPIDYSDIDAVLYTVGYRAIDGAWKGSDGYQPQRPADYQPDEIRASNLWAFWKLSDDPGRYSQYSLQERTGYFRLLAPLGDVIKILRRDRFYELSPPLDEITDTSYSVLTVRRCSIVTRIMIPNADDSRADAATRKLFADFLRLINNTQKQRLSSDPQNFDQTLLFDR
jgi:hypothetical protein